MNIFVTIFRRVCRMMSKDNNIDFSVSTTFQERLSKAFSGDERSNVEIAKEIGISKDVFIRALKAGLIPSTRTLIKIADHLEASIDYLLGLSDDNPQRKTLDDVSFLERLEELRILTNKKYGAIASAVGISRSQFNLWKQKNYIPSLETEASSICGSKRITFPVWKFATN